MTTVKNTREYAGSGVNYTEKSFVKLATASKVSMLGRHGIGHNDTQYNGTCHNETQHNEIVRSDNQHNINLS
jgi:hypothetical protein